MGQVTGGRVVFSRTVKTGDYENKKVEVELTFTVADDSDHAEILDLVGRQARIKAEEMLGLRSGGSVSAGKDSTETVEEAKPAPKPRGRPKAEEAEEPGEWETEAEEAKPGLTEEAVLKLVSAHAQKTGNNKGIKELIAKFSATGKVAGIPEDKRETFVAALEKVKAPK